MFIWSWLLPFRSVIDIWNRTFIALSLFGLRASRCARTRCRLSLFLFNIDRFSVYGHSAIDVHIHIYKYKHFGHHCAAIVGNSVEWWRICVRAHAYILFNIPKCCLHAHVAEGADAGIIQTHFGAFVQWTFPVCELRIRLAGARRREENESRRGNGTREQGDKRTRKEEKKKKAHNFYTYHNHYNDERRTKQSRRQQRQH